MTGQENGPARMLTLHNPALAFDVWVRWAGLGRRHLPSQILAEPTALMDDVLEIDALYNALTRPPDGD